MSSYRIALNGPVPAAALDLITLRFGDIDVRTRRGQSVLNGLVADQAALRALLNTLWDVGADIRLVRLSAAGDGPMSRPEQAERRRDADSRPIA